MTGGPIGFCLLRPGTHSSAPQSGSDSVGLGTPGLATKTGRRPASRRGSGETLPQRPNGGVFSFRKVGRLIDLPSRADLNLGSSGQDSTSSPIIGPPTSGAHVQHEFWRDALGGEFRCTGAGTPETWMQTGLAAVTADPSSGTIPTGYLILNVTSDHIKRHTGGEVWEIPAA